MSAEIVTAGFCPQYFSQFRVLSNQNDTYYSVTLNGTGPAFCTCKAYEFAKMYDKTCKHIKRVWEHGCLYNPQWKDAGPNDLDKVGVEIVATDTRNSYPKNCPGCHEEMIAVKIAV
jgi:hypothetical protein